MGEGVNAADTGGAELVLVQTRDVTGPEATQVYAAAVELQMPDMWRDLLLWFCYAGIFLPWVVAIACGMALSVAFKDTEAAVPSYAANALTLLLPSLMLFSAAMLVLSRRLRTLAARGYSRYYAAGNRYILRAEGIGAVMRGTNWMIPWHRIASVASSDLLLVARIPPVQVIALPKDAFAGQDVAGFCAELERCWKAAVGAAPDEH